ncbi:porin [Amaricoccus solimangrovi]|uniref:Porin n=1 Tax=Amaricoccus solimangrovi TaxID=2589815 RepID=A0A501WES6_9RHOB|nr:porin [Amaricoccus solimangrovi]TPE46574.1 porin [Amaricoccus solimangrovi]
MTKNGRPSCLRALLLAGAASACALTARAEGLPPIEWGDPSGGTLLFYGQINMGVLSYDDGIDTESYGLIDNANSESRVGLVYTRSFGDWTLENTNEIGYAPYSSGNASITHDSPDSSDYEFTNANIRKIDFAFSNDRLGQVSLGQGSMATDGIQEIDLSGTDVIAYSSVADSAAGQILRFSDPGLSFDESLSGVTIGDAFTNYDGPRRVRVRYDTPSFANMTFAAAFGRDLLSDDSDIRDQNIFDAALTYEREYADFDAEAGLGYYWQEDNITTWGGSASGLHRPTGLNLTLGFGTGSPEDGPDGQWYYAKLGLLRQYIAWGATAVSLDYYKGDDFYIAGDATSSDSKSWGLALVQTIDRANTELWLTARDYDYSDNAASYEDGQAIFGGARFRF